LLAIQRYNRPRAGFLRRSPDGIMFAGEDVAI
jgi:hypothetical protein